jgi:phenylpropionate dioxygenase-like ring-hydroxylating dioxygenase large terminal subunit
MDAQQQQVLWAIAREHYEAAELYAQRGWHNVSIVCSYYAVYTAMWVALDDPPHGKWSHPGILQNFAPGQ